jgi:hypothetical protein
MDNPKDIPRKLPEGWRTTREIARSQGHGDHQRLAREARHLSDNLIVGLVRDSALSRPQAETNVKRDFVDTCTPKHGGVPALSVSPRAQAMLPKPYPILKEGWMTGNMLAEEFGGQTAVWDRKIRNLAENVIQEIITKKGISRALAFEWVNENYIGMQQTHGRGVPAMAASPAALEKLHTIHAPDFTHRSKNPPKRSR